MSSTLDSVPSNVSDKILSPNPTTVLAEYFSDDYDISFTLNAVHLTVFNEIVSLTPNVVQPEVF